MSRSDSYDREMKNVDWSEVYEHQRLRSQEIDSWLDALELGPGTSLVDVGAGPGFATLRAALRIGPGGVVYGVDRRPEALAFLAQRLSELQAEGKALARVEPVVADAESFTLPAPADAALITHMLHHTESPTRVLDAVRRQLAPGERAVVAEFDPEGAGEVGPPLPERISRSRLQAWLLEAGYVIERALPGGQEQFALLVRARGDSCGRGRGRGRRQ